MIKSTLKRFWNALSKFVKKLGWKKSIALSILFVLLVMNYFPVKLAVYDKHIPPSNETTVIVELTTVTGPNWWVTGDASGLSAKHEYIDIIGNASFNALTNDLFFFVHNKYVLYGNYVGYVDGANGDGSKARVFKVSDWDFLYPIERDSIGRTIPVIGQFLSPDRYLNIFDFLFKGLPNYRK